MTSTLKLEHAIVDFETWKAAFERDPVGREALGVLRYRVCRPVDDANYVLIDLDFETTSEAKAFLERLQQVWRRADLSPGLARPAGPGAGSPRARVVEEVQTLTYRA